MPQDRRPFADRYGYRPVEKEISVREDAPVEIREGLIALAGRWLGPSALRDAVCEALLRLPDTDNWSADPVMREVTMLVERAPWFKVYDIAESLFAAVAVREPFQPEQFQQQVNALFREHGIGWAMDDGLVVARGGEALTAIPKEAMAVLARAGRSTAANEIHQAMQDLSRRPQDITGAIQHGMAALECVMKDATNEPKKTLGQVIGKLKLPKPLDDAVEKLWGFASNHGRHIAEGKDPAFEDAELVVTVAAAVAIYLSR